MYIPSFVVERNVSNRKLMKISSSAVSSKEDDTTTSSANKSTVDFLQCIKFNEPLNTPNNKEDTTNANVDNMDVDVEMKSLNSSPTKTNLTINPHIELSCLTSNVDNKNMVDCEKLCSNPDDMDTSPGGHLSTIISIASSNKHQFVEIQATCEERLEELISKILNATWNENCIGAISCPQTATFLDNHKERRFDFELIVNNVLMECVLKLYNNEDIDYAEMTGNIDGKSTTPNTATDASSRNLNNSSNQMEISSSTYSTPKKIKSDDNEVQEILANATNTEQPSTSRSLYSGCSEQFVNKCPTPSITLLSPVSVTKHYVILYLVKCYQNYQQNKEIFKFNLGHEMPQVINNFHETLQMLCEQIMRITILVLTDRIQDNLKLYLDHSDLLELCYQERIPDDFLSDLITEAYKQPEEFEQIFSQLLRGLFSGMQRTVFTPNLVTHHMELLTKLVAIKVGNVRPICDLVMAQKNFMPALCTQIPGRELVKRSFLGPFLSVSFFAEENIHFAEFNVKFDSLVQGPDKFRWVKIIRFYSILFQF